MAATRLWRPACSSRPTVLLDRRRLIEWLFEPLFGLAQRVWTA